MSLKLLFFFIAAESELAIAVNSLHSRVLKVFSETSKFTFHPAANSEEQSGRGSLFFQERIEADMLTCLRTTPRCHGESERVFR